jgi:hypothetical protein
MKRISLVLPLMAASLLAIAKPAFSAPIVRQLSEAQAQGLTSGGAQISVWPGSGTNLDFTRTGEVIQRVWLDDPSRLTLDFDGTLCGQGNSGSCDGAGASVIHLRRVTGMHFENLPETAYTLLTAVTDSPEGRKLYQFQVNYGSGIRSMRRWQSPRIPPLKPPRWSLPVVEPPAWWMWNWDCTVPISTHLIAADSPVIAKVQDFLARARNGATPQAAADAAGMSLAVVSRLAEMGLPAVAQPAIPPPTVPLEASQSMSAPKAYIGVTPVPDGITSTGNNIFHSLQGQNGLVLVGAISAMLAMSFSARTRKKANWPEATWPEAARNAPPARRPCSNYRNVAIMLSPCTSAAPFETPKARSTAVAVSGCPMPSGGLPSVVLRVRGRPSR